MLSLAELHEYEAIEKELEKREAYRSLASFVKQAWKVIEPETPLVWNWHLDLLCEYLEAVHEGKYKRLIVNVPPRSLKSIISSICFPSWVWLKNPEVKFMSSSYSQSLSNAHSLGRRDLIQSDWYQNNWGHLFTIAADRNKVTEFGNDKTGQMIATSMLGTATGKGANCVVGSAQIQTEQGLIDLKTLTELKIKPKVLSYNHQTEKFEFKNVIATKRSLVQALVEIQTSSKIKLQTTSEHLLFEFQSGYKQAGNFVQGQNLGKFEIEEEKQNLFSLQEESKWRNGSLPAMSRFFQRYDSNFKMFFMCIQFQNPFIRAQKKDFKRLSRRLLYQAMLRNSSFIQKSKNLFNLRSANYKQVKKILSGLQKQTERKKTQTEAKSMSFLQKDVRSENGLQCALFERMCRFNAFKKNGWQEKFKLQGWAKLWENLHGLTSFGSGARWVSVCGLQAAFAGEAFCKTGEENDSFQPYSSSRRWEREKQQTIESCNTLQPVPRSTSSLKSEPISLVQRIYGESFEVFDIQVEGNHNFIANGLLVHNCLIIDDAHDTTNAESDVQRKTTLDTFDRKFVSRLNNKKKDKIIVIMQRLHEEDLTGHLLAKGGWEHLKLPAEAEDETVYHYPVSGRTKVRHPGDILHESREGADELAMMKRALGSTAYAGQYQQRPAPAEGNILRRQWFQFYKALPNFSEITQSWDLTFKDKQTGDFVSGQVWGVRGSNLYLVHRLKDRLDFIGQLQAIRMMKSRFLRSGAILIEDSANGAAAIATLKNEIPGLLPVKADRDKVSRLNAVVPLVEAGNVWLPDPSIAPWIHEFLDELCSFPNAAHDDEVDAFSQALNYLSRRTMPFIPRGGVSGGY